MKKIFISGGTGFIGSYLNLEFVKKGYNVFLLTRNPEKAKKICSSCKIILGDPTKPGDWQKKIKNMDIIINLAGQNIFSRWTESYKKKILESRVKSTKNIVSFLNKDNFLINASAVGYYGDKGDTLITEESPPGDDFLAKVCLEWEKEALKAKEKNAKVAIIRIGIVLGKGGMFSRILPIFKLGFGGTLGKGNQWFPWIHIKDLVSAIIFLIEGEKEGIYNLVSPKSVTNKEFTEILGKLLKRPAFFRVPIFMLRLIFGELANIISFSVRGYPENLLSEGFKFKFENIEDALKDILSKN